MASRGKAASALAYVPQAALISFARQLSYTRRLAFGAGLMRAAVRRMPDLRRRVEANLTHIYPRMSASERDRIREAMAGHVGRTLVETLTMDLFLNRAAWSDPTGPGWDVLRKSHADGRGAVLVSGHFGQWEAVRGALKARGIECGGLYRPFKNPYLQTRYLANLETGGRPMCTRDAGGLRTLVRHFKRGGVVAVLLDQYTKRGALIDFLGRPAPSGTMIAELALKYDIPLIPCYGTRQPDGIHVAVEMEAPIVPTTPHEMTQAAAHSLSARVHRTPEQYYWLHQRWVKWS